MTPIALYPSDASLKKAAGIGALNIFIGYQFLSWAPNGSALIPWAFALGGLFLIGQAAYAYLKPTPSFEADANGFSVMRKKKQGWDAYRGIHVHTIRVAFFPVMQSIVIKTGKNILGRRVHIKATHLSASAKEMAREIDAYAIHAKRAGDLSEAMAALPAAPLVGHVAESAPRHYADPIPTAMAARDSFAEPKPVGLRSGAGGVGPVESVPSFGERLFGRRKVI